MLHNKSSKKSTRIASAECSMLETNFRSFSICDFTENFPEASHNFILNLPHPKTSLEPTLSIPSEPFHYLPEPFVFIFGKLAPETDGGNLLRNLPRTVRSSFPQAIRNSTQRLRLAETPMPFCWGKNRPAPLSRHWSRLGPHMQLPQDHQAKHIQQS